MVTLKSFKGRQPRVGEGVFIDTTARVIGDVVLILLIIPQLKKDSTCVPTIIYLMQIFPVFII